MGKLLPRSFERIRSGEQIQMSNLYQRRGGGRRWRHGGEVSAPHHLPVRWRHWLGALPCYFGRHELETSRHWRECHLSASRTRYYEQIVSHHSAAAASACGCGRSAYSNQNRAGSTCDYRAIG